MNKVQRFGKLTSKQEITVSLGSHKKIPWICDCGKEKLIEVKKVSSGHSKTCGNCKPPKTDLERKSYRKEWREKNILEVTRKNLQWKAENRERNNNLEKIRRDSAKQAVLNHYGKVCACCGESEIAFLCFDHINNNGAEDREKFGSGTAFLFHLLKDFPIGIRTLCHNCNMSYGNYGYCPHQKEKDGNESL